jgi:hypothetical protein
MSISGIRNPYANTLTRPTSDPRAGGVERGQQQRVPTAGTPAARAQQGLAPLQRATAESAAAVPAEAPQGTDPELWSVLTSEERSHFAKLAAVGPLTYGRLVQGAPATSVAMRGVRLDVRA